MAFKVVEILDGQTIKVTPKWTWTNPEGNKLTGDEIQINGYKLPDSNNSSPHNSYAINKLTKLLINREVILKNPKMRTLQGKISCSVFVDDIDVSYYFPEYRVTV